MGSARFGLDSKRLAIVLARNLRLPLGHQQVSQKQVGIGEAGVSPQRRLELPLRFVETAGSAQGHGIVVSGGGIVWPQPQRDFEVITRPGEIACSRKKGAQVAVRVGVVRLNPDSLSKG